MRRLLNRGTSLRPQLRRISPPSEARSTPWGPSLCRPVALSLNIEKRQRRNLSRERKNPKRKLAGSGLSSGVAGPFFFVLLFFRYTGRGEEKSAAESGRVRLCRVLYLGVEVGGRSICICTTVITIPFLLPGALRWR